MRRAILAACLAATTLSTSPAIAQEGPSRYLQCDGEPNSMTAGEGFARFLGAITLLSIFAPSPENPDPSARLFGEAGVAVCSSLIEGVDGNGKDMEGNPIRRVPLILARAAHHIEAKNYEAAIDDVALARAEATTAGLVGNPYFDRSMGLSFSNIEAAAHLRLGDAKLAERTALSAIEDMRYSFGPSILASDYSRFVRDLSPQMELKLHAGSQIMPGALIPFYAAQLDEAGRFAESAVQWEAYLYLIDKLTLENVPSQPFASTAVSHALSGDWEAARMRADFARSNMRARANAGEPDQQSSQVVELLDLFSILEQFENGEHTMARRMFAARSQWTAPSFGTVLEVTARLREGALEEDLFGSLALSADDLWQQRYDELLAVELQDDTENDDLFDLIVSYSEVDQFEDRAKRTHRIEKSKMMSDEPDENGHYHIWAHGGVVSGIDAIMLHAALQARHQGKEGFTMQLTPSRVSSYYNSALGFARFVDRGENGTPATSFILASDVIAELEPMIPTREEVKRRQKERRNNR